MWGIEIVLSGGIHRNDAAAASTFASGVTVHHPPHQAARAESMRRQPPFVASLPRHKPEARDDADRVALAEHATAAPGLALSAGSSSYAPSPPGTWPWLAAHHQYQAFSHGHPIKQYADLCIKYPGRAKESSLFGAGGGVVDFNHH